MDKLSVVLASPSDLTQEREMIMKVVGKLNEKYTYNDLYIDLRMWEKTDPGFSSNGAQGVIDNDLQIEKADIFICLYWKREGTIIESEGVAGTEHELRKAIECWKKNNKLDIKVYFKDVSNEEKQESSYRKIQQIINYVTPLGL